MKVRALIMIDAKVADQAPDEAWDALFDLIKNGYAEDEDVEFRRPDHRQICEFVGAQSNWIEVPEEPEPAELEEAEQVEEESSSTVQLVQPSPEVKEMFFHWGRLPWEVRTDIAFEMGLITEDELTSVKRDKFNETVFEAASKTGVLSRLWECIQAYRAKWGEI